MKDYFWSDHFAEQAIAQVEILIEVLDQRLLPAFEDISEEADRHAEDVYQHLGSMSMGSDVLDMADAAEVARDEGIERYEALTDIRQAILNALTVALYHLIEQQLLLFLRRHVLHPREENDPKLWSMSTLIDRMRSAGIDLTTLTHWDTLQELRLAANTIKHADGKSADELHALRPELFVEPTLRSTTTPRPYQRRRVYAPMAGDDLFISRDDLRAFAEKSIGFLRALSTALRP